MQLKAIRSGINIDTINTRRVQMYLNTDIPDDEGFHSYPPEALSSHRDLEPALENYE